MKTKVNRRSKYISNEVKKPVVLKNYKKLLESDTVVIVNCIWHASVATVTKGSGV